MYLVDSRVFQSEGMAFGVHKTVTCEHVRGNDVCAYALSILVSYRLKVTIIYSWPSLHCDVHCVTRMVFCFVFKDTVTMSFVP